MDFEIPAEIEATLDALDAFIAAEIAPLQAQDDNERFFDHRREYSRTDFDHDGVPRADWEELLAEMRRRADAAGWLRLALPAEFGGRDASNLEMAFIREHLAHKGLGLFNDLKNESSVVGNFPTVLMMRDFGTEAQKAEWMPGFLAGTRRFADRNQRVPRTVRRVRFLGGLLLVDLQHAHRPRRGHHDRRAGGGRRALRTP
jgi:acyl-CoA dehydrogenase